jgi:hypothetical protein
VSLAFVATALRVYVRTCLVKAFGWDDALMVLAFVSLPRSPSLERNIHTDCLACPLHVRDMCNRRHQMGYRTTHGWALERRNIYGDESKLSRCTNSIVVLTQTLQYWWLCYIGYCLAMILSKISIGVFLLRVTVQKIHKWIIYAAMAITGFTGAVFFFVTVFQCTPISYFCRFFKIWALR